MNRIYRLLEIPFVYRLVNMIFAPGGHRLIAPLHQEAFGQSSGRVLDVGCGPRLNTPEPKGLLVGVDVNESYIKSYTGGLLDKEPGLIFKPPVSRRRLGFVASADKLPFKNGSFDEARSHALFHHLPNEVAFRTIQEMHRCVRTKGRIVILDAVWPKKAWKRPIAWLTLRLDRGIHARSQEEMLELARKACPGPWEWKRRTITYTGQEFLCLQHVKG